jgi:NAD(P)-dependent dehydrogenase (short-subunit alcohol dehydrogenase family)
MNTGIDRICVVDGSGPAGSPRSATDRPLLPVGWMPPEVVTKAVLFLASDDAEHITGVALPVDVGWLNF